MARPRIDNKRDKLLAVMLSAAEYEAVRLEAAQAGQSLSSYSRDIILDRPALTIVPEVNKKRWIELARTASNLNQLTHWLNSGGSGVDDLPASFAILPVLEELKKELETVRLALLGSAV